MNTQLGYKYNALELEWLIKLANVLGYSIYRHSDNRFNLMNTNDLFSMDVLSRVNEFQLSEYLISRLNSTEEILNYLLRGVSKEYLEALFFAIRDQNWYSDPLVEKIKKLDGNSQMLIMSRINNYF